MIEDSKIFSALEAAIAEAQKFLGSTAPNPPVGACALDAAGNILSLQAHQKAGSPHAEALVIQDLKAKGILSQAHALVVTLEPCNHQGRTPPCSEAIMSSGIKNVVIGCKDPNPLVLGGGHSKLIEAGVQSKWIRDFVEVSRARDLENDCLKLIQAFSHWSIHRRPWIIVKTAHDRTGSMIPPPGQKTFTSTSSLELAHQLRKQSDAILTGIGTVLADRPEFTVRHIPDHPGKNRWIVVLDRQGRLPEEWKIQREAQGFQVITFKDLEESLIFLGQKGVLQVLIEAGPTLTRSILSTGFWNQHVVIRQGSSLSDPDQIEWKSR